MSNCTITRPATFEDHVNTALLLVTQGQLSDARLRAVRAEDHADQCQDLLTAALHHPATRAGLAVATGPRLAVIDGGIA